jgi:hypothetical protein
MVHVGFTRPQVAFSVYGSTSSSTNCNSGNFKGLVSAVASPVHYELQWHRQFRIDYYYVSIFEVLKNDTYPKTLINNLSDFNVEARDSTSHHPSK